ncbi:sugar phosphate isomerase/epimerase family protein, partial [Thermus scotoductus]|uniref:sugar phosphate isomerase/epimerase family protein n=1 Tax=Thermus scotoductus TaxID=37636 RepID=UPI001F02FCD9
PPFRPPPLLEPGPPLPDPGVARLSRARLSLGLRWAQALGADRAVLHSGLPPYTPKEAAGARAPSLAQALGPLLEEAQALEAQLFLENTFEPDPESLEEVFRLLPGLGFCFDPAHARVFSRTPDPQAWLALRPRHLHLNGTDGLYDRHWQLDQGGLDLGWLRDLEEEGLVVVLEVRGDPTPSLRYLEALLDQALTPGA